MPEADLRPAPGARPAPIPLTVLTGFLGAGKTTVLNGLLRDPALADTLVIINELGDVALDHLLVEEVEDGLVLLSAGCLCCTVRGDLVTTLEDLLRRRDNGRIEPFRRILIETTGLADPAPVLSVVLDHPYLSIRFVLAAVVTVVDAVNGVPSLHRHPEAVRQVALADRLLVSKTDLAAGPAADALETRLRTLNPVAPIIRVVDGSVDAATVLGGGLFDPDGKIGDVAAWLSSAGDEAAAEPVHSGSVQAFTLRSQRPIGAGAFDTFTEILRATFGSRILRLKGLVEFAERPGRPVVVHGVQHLLHVPAELPEWPDADRTTRLVVIVDDLPREPIERLWNAFAGRPEVDRPDAAALVDNPLAPATLAR